MNQDDKFWVNLIFIGFTIFAGYLFLHLFTNEAPSGQFVSNPVQVIDDEGDQLYLTLLVSVDNGDSKPTYDVVGIISNTGKVKETYSDGNYFGQKCYFSYKDTDYETVLHVKDLQISLIDRLKGEKLSIILRLLFLVFMIALTTYNFIANKNPRK